MKFIDKDIIDSLVERQTLIEIVNYNESEIEQRKDSDFWYNHFLKQNLFTASDEAKEYWNKIWQEFINHWIDKRDNYIKKSVNVSWYQDKEYLKQKTY